MRKREAIQASINHWKRMRDDWQCGEIPLGDECALCDKYFNHTEASCTESSCDLCPLCKAVGPCRPDIDTNPWHDANEAFDALHDYNITDYYDDDDDDDEYEPTDEEIEDWKTCANRMIKTLRSLL